MDHKYFENALSNFTFDLAGGSAICHLADQGYSVKRIKESLAYSIPFEKIQETVWSHFLRQETILLNEPSTGIAKEKTTYVEERGKYGRVSFRSISIPNENSQDIQWNTVHYTRNAETSLYGYLAEKCCRNPQNAAYASCDFGTVKKKDAKGFETMLRTLNSRQREYIEGLPWPGQRIYHQLNQNILETIGTLYEKGQYTGCCYFIGQKEKIFI